MNRYLIISLGLIVISSCTQYTKKKKSVGKELFTLYEKKDTIINVKRMVTNNDNTYLLLSYQVNLKMPEVIEQKFIKEETFKAEPDIKKELPSYNWQPVSDTPVLFVQISGQAFKNEMEVLDKRQEVEQKIDILLKTKKQGEWFAGDIGPGGANMLFFVTDFNEAEKSVIEFLIKEHLETKTAIARRVNMEDGNWFYEVIYPKDFSGYFITQ